jgi:hypothetical protein
LPVEEEDAAAPTAAEAPKRQEQLKARRVSDKQGAERRARESVRHGGRKRMMAKSEVLLAVGGWLRFSSCAWGR